MNAFPWTIFFILLAAGLLSSVAVIPYALSINPQALDKLKETNSGSGQPIVAQNGGSPCLSWF